MARARNIKPAFFKNEDLAELSFASRLLFIGLWTLADREGRLEDRHKRIRMEIFPGDDVNVDKALQDLHDKRFIVRYVVDGQRYISIPTFLKHQNPHHREPASTIPKPEAGTPWQPGGSPRLDPVSNTTEPEARNGCNADEAQGSPGAGLSLAVLNPESPSLNPESPIKSAAHARESSVHDPAATGRGRLSAALRAAGVQVTSQNPFLVRWVEQGVTGAEAKEAVDRARMGGKPSPVPIPAKYLDRIIADIIAERANGGRRFDSAGPSNTARAVAALEEFKRTGA